MKDIKEAIGMLEAKSASQKSVNLRHHRSKFALFVTYRLRPGRLVTFELIPQLVQDVVEVVLVFHDVEHKLQELLVDFLHESLQRFSLDVDQDDLDDVGELLLIHFFHEFLLVSLNLLFLLCQFVLWRFEYVLALHEPEVVVLLKVVDEFTQPAERLIVSLANLLLLRWLVLQESVQFDNDFLIKRQASRLLHLKILQEEIKLIERFLAQLCL